MPAWRIFPLADSLNNREQFPGRIGPSELVLVSTREQIREKRGAQL
jgi:hypothetical protein